MHFFLSVWYLWSIPFYLFMYSVYVSGVLQIISLKRKFFMENILKHEIKSKVKKTRILIKDFVFQYIKIRSKIVVNEKERKKKY